MLREVKQVLADHLLEHHETDPADVVDLDIAELHFLHVELHRALSLDRLRAEQPRKRVYAAGGKMNLSS